MLWGELTVKERCAAMLLDYNALLWNCGATTSTAAKPWNKLTTLEREAAKYLGYDVCTWNAELALWPDGPEARTAKHKTLILS